MPYHMATGLAMNNYVEEPQLKWELAEHKTHRSDVLWLK